MFISALLYTLDTHYLPAHLTGLRAIFWVRYVADLLLADITHLVVYVYDVSDLA